ncbi:MULTISPECIES: ATP-dependent nuclease [Acidiphilium]|uniref:AAA domain-containing protein, putative AbiEii toxin, Type IV TA system n=1 Tax=Acidiphilium rubrum TaxID=526 RepID=A0A8G2CN22_ACIRU|nr:MULTISPECIES: AAA family ATPase [Acidiphilium]SIR35677.1 AAA domain-containing protein, putative AbiEii toxin, Type IV TA system [Acidiphilium rubrum]
MEKTAELTHEKPRVSIQRIQFSGGQEFDFQANEKILVVGPNNSGKSEFLREVNAAIGWMEPNISFASNKVVKDLYLSKEGTSAELEVLLRECGEKIDHDLIEYQSYRIHINQTIFFSQRFLGPLAPLYCKNLGAEGRLAITAVQKGVGADGHRSKPQHVMYDNDKVTKRVSNLFKKAFGKDLFFDFRANPDIPIYVGIAPDQSVFPDRVSDEYVNTVRESPRLDLQGDGMKSYAGILFEVIAIEHDITLLDEPEAFLHPPQMRRLGETLAAETQNQIFVATHSSDILRGFLNTTGRNVRIIRLRRDGDKNHATMTSPERLNELWDQPELRYSNALDGIFHEEVVICEDDSDCRLYNSIADFLGKQMSKGFWPDTAYIPCGGKSAIPKIANALREIGVRVKVVADIDILNDEHMLKAVIDAVGGDWKAVAVDWKQVDEAVRNGVKPLSKDQIKDGIRQIIDGHSEDGLPKSAIQDLLKQTSPWAMVKKYGKSHIPNGQAQAAFMRLDFNLRAMGVFIVPVGEAENFCPEIGSHGPRYVSKIFTTYQLGDPQLKQLREFVASIFGNNLV